MMIQLRHAMKFADIRNDVAFRKIFGAPKKPRPDLLAIARNMKAQGENSHKLSLYTGLSLHRVQNA